MGTDVGLGAGLGGGARRPPARGGSALTSISGPRKAVPTQPTTGERRRQKAAQARLARQHPEQHPEQPQPEGPSAHEQGWSPDAQPTRPDLELGPPPAHDVQSSLVVVRCASPPQAVVGCPFARIAERPISFVESLKASFRPRARIDIWMTPLGAAVIRRPDLVGGCGGLDAKISVVVFRVGFGHHPCPIHKPGSTEQVPCTQLVKGHIRVDPHPLASQKAKSTLK